MHRPLATIWAAVRFGRGDSEELRDDAGEDCRPTGATTGAVDVPFKWAAFLADASRSFCCCGSWLARGSVVGRGAGVCRAVTIWGWGGPGWEEVGAAFNCCGAGNPPRCCNASKVFIGHDMPTSNKHSTYHGHWICNQHDHFRGKLYTL